MEEYHPPTDHLSERDFRRLGELIQDYCGIRMPPVKKTMVEGRLRRRVRALNLSSLDDYCRRLFDEGQLGSEMVELIDAVTTNKTEFFREIEHFRFLTAKALPHLQSQPHRPGHDRPLKIWSAACSIGAEPYTLAMVLGEHARTVRDFRFDIYATDICTDVLEKAKMGIFPEDMAREVPHDLAKRYLRRSRDRARPTVRLIPDLRQRVHFGHLNLMDSDYPMDTDMDIIFCRNALIYFDKATQHTVLSKLCRHLRPGGFLMVGHSESVLGGTLPLTHVTSAVFMRS